MTMPSRPRHRPRDKVVESRVISRFDRARERGTVRRILARPKTMKRENDWINTKNHPRVDAMDALDRRVVTRGRPPARPLAALDVPSPASLPASTSSLDDDVQRSRVVRRRAVRRRPARAKR